MDLRRERFPALGTGFRPYGMTPHGDDPVAWDEQRYGARGDIAETDDDDTRSAEQTRSNHVVIVARVCRTPAGARPLWTARQTITLRPDFIDP